MNEKEKIHGNSKKSKKKQHIYEIIDGDMNDSTVKYGLSGAKLNKNGTSPRANQQVNELNKWENIKRFFAKILMIDIDDREKALRFETDFVKDYKSKNNGSLPPGQKRPNP